MTLLRRGLPATALAAAVLVPAASARSAAQLELAVLPLPKPVIGAAARSLAPAADSGVDSNAHAASQATGNVTAKQLGRLGRVSGYLLDYGTPFGDKPGVSEIATEVERYRTAAEARDGLAFWRRQELDVRPLKQFGLDASVKKLALPGARVSHWAYVTTGKIRGLRPLYGVDAQMLEGAYLLDVSVAASSTGAAKRLAPVIARKLDQRFRLAQAGRLNAKPVKLPRRKAGPPAHGPRPSGMVLTRSDVGSPAKIAHAGYVSPKNGFDEYAVSVYDLTLAPAGSYGFLEQEVSVAGTALEVKYFSALAGPALTHALGKTGKVTPVNLQSVGDNAYGELVQVSVGGSSAYEAVVVLSRGKYLDFAAAASTTTTLSVTDVQSLARKAAHRLNAGLAG